MNLTAGFNQIQLCNSGPRSPAGSVIDPTDSCFGGHAVVRGDTKLVPAYGQSLSFWLWRFSPWERSMAIVDARRHVRETVKPPTTLLMPGVQALALSEELHEMGSVCGVDARVTIDQQGTAFAVSVTADDVRGWSALVARDGEVSRDRP